MLFYTRDICPVFSINGTPETTYYPCEGVIAVGEVKSTLDRESLEDAFKKTASVKRLQRHVVYHPIPMPDTGKRPVNTRAYGTIHGDQILRAMEGEEPAETTQILGFVIAGDIRIKPDTFCDAFKEFNKEIGDQLSPNLVAILSGALLTWGNITKGKIRQQQWSERTGGYVLSEREGTQPTWETSWSATKSDWLRYSQQEDSFRTLIRWISQAYREGKTTDAKAFDRYFLQKPSANIPEAKYIPKGAMTMETALRNLGIKP